MTIVNSFLHFFAFFYNPGITLKSNGKAQSILQNYHIQLIYEIFLESFSHIFMNVWTYKNLLSRHIQTLYPTELFL